MFFNKKIKNNSLTDFNNSQSDLRQITLSEVSNHSISSDCWLVIDGNVYDVTKYIPSHPGGSQILQGCGKDATSIFNSRPNDGTSHSDRARVLLPNYQVGVLVK